MEGTNQRNIETEDSKTQTPLGRCLVDGDSASTTGRSRGKAFGLSFAIESAALALLIVAPILTSVAKPQLINFARPMEIDLAGWRAHNTNQTPTSRPTRPGAPLPILDLRPEPLGHIVNSTESPEPGDNSPPGEMGEIISNAIAITDLGLTQPKAPPQPPVQQNVPEKHPVKVSGDIEQAQLISRIEPRYSPLALQIKLQGTVVLHAIISRDGRITSLEVVSGHALLVQSALDAVRQWRYRPTLLGGEPVEVETTITVTFRLQP